MSLQLMEVISDGPSRHRIRKGLILTSRAGGREPGREEQERIASRAAQSLAAHGADTQCRVEADPSHPALLNLVTPLAAVHTPAHRDVFFARLGRALGAAYAAAESAGFTAVGAGLNPFAAGADSQPPTLCADVHEVEVLDDLEVNRIYNLFRQYLPELIAASAHSALHAGQLRKDLTTRMRISPSSFTPPALALFSRKQLDRLNLSLRRDFGLGDLAQLDVSPVAPGAVVLRFVDAQCSVRFIRAQTLLFQAVATHGRLLARRGSQMPTLHSRIIGQNKALAIEAGPGAVLKPDQRREVKRMSDWYQDRKVAQRASTALLQAIEHRTVEDSPNILAALRTLKAGWAELAPLLLGAELRERGESCLVSYGEYQVRTFYVAGARWQEQLRADLSRLASDPGADLLLDYNASKFPEPSARVAEAWARKLGAGELVREPAGAERATHGAERAPAGRVRVVGQPRPARDGKE
jgi:hypothetical protein